MRPVEEGPASFMLPGLSSWLQRRPGSKAQGVGNADPGPGAGPGRARRKLRREGPVCPRERGSWWEKAHSGDLVVRKRPLHRLLANSLLNCTTHHVPHAARLGHPPCGPSPGPGPRGSLSLLIRGMGTVLATSQGSRERAFRGPPIQPPLHDGKMWAQERRNQNHSRSTLSPRRS